MEDLLKPLWGWEWLNLSMTNDTAQTILMIILMVCSTSIGYSVFRLGVATRKTAEAIHLIALQMPRLEPSLKPSPPVAAWEAYVLSLDTPEKFNAAFKNGSFQRTLAAYADEDMT